ncbi:DUF2637 domain-containing protein [Streptomyces sp. NPDC057235]|uniref:DUF2637 domain-containing protein n=1 Tax=Streptomyces sp. NPDC057235 TaxID=3346058 RepID=UPI00363B303F
MTIRTSPILLTRTHRILIGVIIAGAVVIAGIGFAGSYTAVRELAEQKGFGNFSYFFPIGVDAGICVLLALDLLLTWLRIPFPLLRQTAWLLTAATIAFNGAASWPDPLGVGMHSVIPVLFVVTVEAARHAVGRIADITADKHMEGVRLTRWLLSPLPTFLLWRRMKLWEIRSYEQAVTLEQHRLIYESQLRSQYGRRWRRKAPVEEIMPLRLARYGVPLAETAGHVLEGAGVDLSTTVSVVRADEPTAFDDHQRALEAGAGQTARSKEEDTAEGLPTVLVSLLKEETAAGQRGAEQDFEPSAPVPAPATDVSVSAEANARHPFFQPAKSQPAVAPVVVDEPTTTVDKSAGNDEADSSPHPFFEPAAPRTVVTEPAPDADEPHVREPAGAPAATVIEESRAGGGVPEQISLDLPSARPVEPAGDSMLWEATVADTGEATARLPEQQTAELALEPVEQQIVMVSEWLVEAEERGEKLSGAEVGRRLGLSPRTGQRRLDKAAEYLAEQRRQQGRAHLRSVKS